MHDINDLELRGVPSIFVASTEFQDAAVAQSAALGFDTPGYFVQHPIQDRTDEEMQTLADSAYGEILQMLCEE